jgi:hypothetical protein
MRYAVVGVVALVIVGAARASSGGHHAPDFLVALTARVAAGNCDARPVGAKYVRTTRQAAETIASGDRVDSDTPVYLVLLRGDFVDYYAHGIYRTRDAFPRGTAITFTVDAETRKILDFGIGTRSPHLARLGPVHGFTAEVRRRAADLPSPPVCG